MISQPPPRDRSSELERRSGIDTDLYLRRGIALLDAALEKFEQGMVTLGMDQLVLELRRLRDEDDACWRSFMLETCSSHPIAGRLREDPLTRRSLLKPRGYPGDAEMLDFIFASDRIPAGTSSIGASIFSYTTDGPAPRSVRARAAMTAGMIDGMAAHAPLRVLAVMSGHLREAGLSRAVKDGAVEKYLAFDQDSQTLAAIDTFGYGPGITTYQGTLRSLFRGKSVFRNFDLVYSPLCDNLPDTTVSHFISTLFDALAPGGRLVVSNFAPELVDVGYMEAFMDWNLIYRTENELARLAEHLPGEKISEMKSYRDPHGNIVFLEIWREGTLV